MTSRRVLAQLALPPSGRLALAMLLAFLSGVAFPSVAADKTFGFTGMEFFKLDWDTHNLRLADVNGDGLTDIVVANNARARIDCLIQRKPDAKPAAPDAENYIPNDSRFENRRFLTEKKIFSLELGDLNGDGRTDMAYYGDPRELVVVYQDANGQWGARKTFDIADGGTQQGALAIGDLNGDGRNDIALVATDGTYFIYQNAQGKLEAPIKEAGVPEGAIGLAIGDFNGDGRADLLYVCSNESAPYCFRFQNADGRLGPEIRCKAPAIRTVTTGDADGDGVQEIGTVTLAQGRLVIYKTQNEPAGNGLLDGTFERYALRGSASRKPHALAFAAFTDPKRLDILVTDPDGAEVELFAQTQPGLWNRKAAFPSLQGVSDMAVLTGADGRPEVLFLSPDEPMLGWSRMDAQGRLTFPRSLAVAGKPTCMCLGDLKGDGKVEVLYVSKQERDYSVRVLTPRERGAFEERLRIPLEDVRAEPDGILCADANGDGKPDVLLFIPYQEMRILKATADGRYTDVSRGADYGKGLVQGARLKSVAVADVNGDGKPEILMASKNFARALRLDEKDRLQIVDQFNGRSPTSQIVGVAAVSLNGDPAPEIVLVDVSNRCLTALKRSAVGAYEIAENLQTGPVAFERIIAADLGGAGKPALVLVGQNDFSILQPGRSKTVLREVASYETAIRNGRLEGIAVGKLDPKEKRPQILVTEATKNVMEVISWTDDGRSLKRVLSWPIFEARSFPGPRGSGGGHGPQPAEPREFDVGDLTNDGKPDLVLLVHDRVLVYPQE